ncbi:MAG: hypothetical protein UR60_C0001G0028 [Candidatus Moranbacteria bacterium GW2011_GWF2_34_56]|nr:MAG: hypothetical protein UR51_C0002G0023 [Candidatus Moranbacteria bacterium GW2011_GWF1_34_10]KKP65421.1 MAG: hypothetical protein UR60_C0001G0028 [Candidatus Moranbacteria bacterium GW2011_GWF2_34_56]
MKAKNSLQLNKKDKQIYIFANIFISLLFLLFFIFMLIRTIFPSQFFTFSFANMNSLKNTITEVTQKNDSLNFFASTPLEFSHVKINIEFYDTNAETKIENGIIDIQKSHKVFFYPESAPLNNLENKEENILVSVDESVFIIGNQKKTPIDSTITFESLGYNWDNLNLNTADLSSYEKQKLADISAAHPTGTILKTTEKSSYYFIEDMTKKRILSPSVEKIKNPISVEEKSLLTHELCNLQKNTLSGKKYSCTATLSQLNEIIGKDYRFTIDNLPSDVKIKKIDLEFKKSINKDNFQFFLSELKKKVLYRFGQGE